MKTILCVLLITFSVFSFAQREFQTEGSMVIETAEGDLDGDQVAEKVIIYHTKDTADYGNIREIQILKKDGNQYKILNRSRTAVLEGEKRRDREPYWHPDH